MSKPSVDYGYLYGMADSFFRELCDEFREYDVELDVVVGGETAFFSADAEE